MSKKPSKKNPVFGISSKKQKIIGSWLLSTTTSDATSSSATSTNATATDSSAFPSSNAVFGSTGGKENNVHEKPAAVPTYGRRTSNEDEDREPDTLPTFSSTAGHRTTNASRPSATTALLSPASARVIGEEIKDSDGRVVISLLDSDEDVEDDDDKKPAASVLGHGSCTSSGDTSASSNAVGRWTTSTSNASRTPATHMRQALIAPVVLPETKDQLGSNDLLPRDEEQVENALTKVSAMLKLAALVWRSLRGYGLSMFIKHYIKTSGMAKGEPKSAEDDTDIDVEESTEPLTYETMMANLDEDEIVSGTYIHDIIYLQYMFRFTFALLIFFIMYKTPYPSSTAAITMLSSTLSKIIFAQRLLTSLWNIQMVACWIKLWKA
jgi:hypothetical protein